MAKEKIHVLLTYVDDDSETYCKLFRTREGLMQYVLKGIREDWEELHHEDIGDGEDAERELEARLDDAEKHLVQNGVWNAGDGITYVYDEQEVIG